MANYGNNQNFWDGTGQNQSQDFNFEIPDQELHFQTFENTQQPSGTQITYTNVPPGQYAGSFLDGSQAATGNLYGNTEFGEQKTYTGNEFDDEPPLLEELGINPQHIIQKTLSVLNPFRTTEKSIFEDTDLAGPLVFCMAFGSFLLLSGKVTFSYIYGIGVLGCLAFYCLLSLMATTNVTLAAVISVLGYCLLPMVVLSGINVLITIQGLIGMILTGFSILWCAISASKLFVTALSMDHQQILVAYPVALFYGVFALITIF
ncbi:CLUMA_CG000178, isoform A [Clunio marinus]|uniref:Protein YIPF n=1 Tax=Clunio marinus TaxID=568069 RepID=A0A1J1HEK7_9DIPT|nr:CLUMA_CG000178, isoform A [Clunio marinus]